LYRIRQLNYQIYSSGHQTAQEEEVRRLKRELEIVKQERDILKKALGIFSRGPQ
jgi:transposase